MPLGMVGAALAWVGLAAGCRATSAADPANGPAYPPDFALVFFVDGLSGSRRAEPPDPRRRSAQHVVTADRWLRVALGPGVGPDHYPPATARLHPDQIAELYRLADAAGLTPGSATDAGTEPQTTPDAPLGGDRRGVDPTSPVAYRVVLTAHGRRVATTVDPARNPAAAALLDELIRLRGGR